MTIKLKPLGHRVLVEPVLNEEKGKTEWGFDMSHTDTHKREVAATERGRVVAIGPNAWKAFDDGEPWAKVGDVVIFAKYGGKFIAHPDNPEKLYIIINDDDLQAEVEDL